MPDASNVSPLRVLLYAGGDSAEREVSLATGAGVAAALQGIGHSVTIADPVNLPVAAVDWSQFDVCFLALHGGAGEDGRIQAELEARGVPFTGSGSAASRRAMSKSQSKECFWLNGLPTKNYELVHRTAINPQQAETGVADGGTTSAPTETPLKGWAFPLVIKPDADGSSLGLSLVESPEQLLPALAAAHAVADVAIAEEFIAGREFTVAVLGDRPLPPIEIVKANACFGFEDKYKRAETVFRFESDLPASTLEMVQEIGLRAARALETAGLVRVDLIVDEQGQPWLLEVNTLPGMTATSLAPKAAARIGMSLGQLCHWCLEDALSRARVA